MSTYDEALERIRELEEELESLDALLQLRERAKSDNGDRHTLLDVTRDIDAEDLLRP